MNSVVYYESFKNNESSNDTVITNNLIIKQGAKLILDGDLNTNNENTKIYLPPASSVFIGNTTDTLANNINAGSVPPGIIMMWAGAINTIPLGWSICDGGKISDTFIKPNLVGRFVMCSNSSYQPNSVGGNSTYSLTLLNIPPHSHTVGSTNSHEHNHGIPARSGGDNNNNSFRYDGRSDFADQNVSTSDISSGSFVNHTHSYTTLAGGGTATPAAISLIPRCYALIYIIKLPPT